MAGLPQEGETPVGFGLFKTKFKSFVPTFTFWGQKISTSFVYWKVLSVYLKPPREQEARTRNML